MKWLGLALSLSLCVGCGDATGTDGGAGTDSGPAADSGSIDAGATDASTRADAGPGDDGGTGTDAAISIDAAPGTDAVTGTDAGRTPPGSINCDERSVACDAPPPSCPTGEVAEVGGGCWTSRCVPIDTCYCTGPDMCPNRSIYTCHMFRMRCGPYL